MDLPIASDSQAESPARDPSSIEDFMHGITAMREKMEISANMHFPWHSEDFEEGSTDGGPRHAHSDRGPSMVESDSVKFLEDIGH